MHWDGWWMGHMGWMSLWWILILVLLVLSVVWLVKQSASGRSERSAEEILKTSYARGEIDREEYQRRLNDIRR